MYIQIEALIPVGIQCLLDYTRRLGLFTIDRCNRKGVREACME